MSDEGADTEDDGGGGKLDVLGGMGDNIQEQQERAEELREKQDSDGSESEQSSEAESNEEGTDSTEAEDDLPAVKDRDNRVLVYLPQEITQEWEVARDTMKLEWSQNGDGTKLEKLRHIYPILMMVGLEDAKELDAEEIAEYKEMIERYDREDSE